MPKFETNAIKRKIEAYKERKKEQKHEDIDNDATFIQDTDTVVMDASTIDSNDLQTDNAVIQDSIDIETPDQDNVSGDA